MLRLIQSKLPLHFLLLSFFCLNLNIADAQTDSKELKEVKVTVDEFRIISGNSKFESLKKIIPEAFALKFIIHPNIAYVDKDTILYNAVNILKKDSIIDIDADFVVKQSKYVNPKIFTIQRSLDSLGIDYILSGIITELDNRIKIEVNSYKVSDGSSFKFNYGYVAGPQLIQSVDEISNKVIENIVQLPSAKRKTIAILPFTQEGDGDCLNYDELTNNIGQTIFYGWSNDNYEIVPWYKTDHLSLNDKKDRSQLKKNDVDAAIHGFILTDCNKDSLFVIQKIYVMEADIDIEVSHIGLSDIENISENSNFLWQINSDLNQISSSILSKNGEWNFQPFLIDSADFDFNIQQSEMYKEKKDYFLSHRFLAKAIEIRPDDLDARLLLAENYLLSKMVLSAEMLYQELILEFDSLFSPRYSLAEFYFKMSDFDKTIETLHAMDTLGKGKLEYHILLSKAFMAKGEVENMNLSFQSLTDANNLDPSNAEVYYLLGRYYQEMDSLNLSEEMFEKAVHNQDDFIEARWALRGVKVELGKEVFMQARIINSLNKDDPAIPGFYSSAEKYFSEAVRIAPGEEIYMFLRLIYLYTNNFKDARKLIDEGIQQGYFDSYTYYRHAYELRDIEDKNDEFYKPALNEAIYYFKKYSDIYPFDDISYRRIGSCHFRNQNYTRAEKSYIKALKLNPYLVDNYMNLTEVQLMIGKYPEAMMNIEKLREIGFTGRFADQDELITDYLYLVAQYLNSNSMQGLESDYDVVKVNLHSIGIDNLKWNFKTFEKWLDSENRHTRDIDPAVRMKIQNITRP